MPSPSAWSETRCSARPSWPWRSWIARPTGTTSAGGSTGLPAWLTVPEGFDFDYVGSEAVTEVLRVEDGALVADGARYRLLHLGGSSERMTLPTLSAIERLLDGGATLVGRRPLGSPSLADDPRAFYSACDRIWARSRASGRVIETADLGAALADLGIRPAMEIEGPPVHRITRLIDHRRVTVLSNPSDEAVEVRLVVSDEFAPLVAWDPVEVRRAPLRPEPRSDGRTGVRVALPPFGSLFVVAGAAAPPVPVHHTTAGDLNGDWRLTLPDRPPIEMPSRPRLWTELDDDARGFSGIGTYRHEFSATAELLDADRLVLELGTVRDIARVTINGTDCGIAWTEPFHVEIGAAIRSGTNVMEIEVATPWRNRLIRESTAPSGRLFEPMTAVFEASAAPLDAGLAGPVQLIVERSA